MTFWARRGQLTRLQKSIQIGQQGVNCLRLNLVWRVPAKPAKTLMFRGRDLHVAQQLAEKYHQGFVAFEAAEFGRPDRVLVDEPEFRIQSDITGGDRCFFFQLAQGALDFAFALIDVSFGQVPAIRVLHQQELGDRFATHDQDSARHDFSHMMTGNGWTDGWTTMKIYTKAGDDGKTGLFRGPRVAKDDARIEAYGTVDELSSVIGVARASDVPGEIDLVLERIQHQLFSLGAELATPDPQTHGTILIGPAETDWIEQTIDRFSARLPPLEAFILPAGTPTAAALHHARVVCRRAERRVVTLSHGVELSKAPLVYLNRVGDLLFVLARFANFLSETPDIPWRQSDD